jgi:hypothetical protein
VAAVAQQRSIQLRSVRATLTAEMDLHGILGADPDIRNGFSGVTVSYQIDADATAEEIRALVLASSRSRSCLFSSFVTSMTSSPTRSAAPPFDVFLGIPCVRPPGGRATSPLGHRGSRLPPDADGSWSR